MPDSFADVLIERNGIVETAAARMRRGREETIISRMTAIDIRMGDAAENGEIAAMLLQDFNVRRKGVIAPGILWEEVLGQEAEIIADGEHAPGFGGSGAWCSRVVGSPGKSGNHGIEQRQRKHDSGAAQEGAAGQSALDRDVYGGMLHTLIICSGT